MTPWLLEFTVNNVLLSAVLAIIAFAVHRAGKLPAVAHLLWVLVLLKLVTPPVVMLPMFALPEFGSAAIEPWEEFTDVSATFTAAEISDLDLYEESSWLATHGVTILLACWAGGTLVVLAWSLFRVMRFNQLLRQASLPVPAMAKHQTARLAQQLGIRRLPQLVAVSASLSPLIWWIGGRVKLVLPAQLLEELDSEELRWALAHELGHVRRRDYLIRWLEWLACVAFWWNPIAWLARRNLRANEEICCDALVLSTLRPRPKAYGNALLAVVEFLSAPAIRPPAVASELNSGGFLERRFEMIMSNKRSAVMPRWLTGFLLLTTFCLLPLGVAYGQDFEAVQKRLGKAVAKGEITLQQANTMMVALKQNAAGTAKVTAAQGDYKRMLAEVQAAVKAGKLSKEQAEAKYAAVKKMYAAQVEQAQAGKSKAAAEYEQFARKLKAAVEAKQITEAEAKAKYDALRKEYARAAELSQAERRALEEKQAEYKAAYADVLNRVKSAIDAGEISPEEGRAKMAAIKREMEARAAAAKIKKAPAAEQAQAAKVEYERAMLKIREAAEAGKISKEEAAQKSAAMRAEIREYEQAAATRAEYQARQAAELEAVMQKIKEALDRGDISREEAEQKLRDLKEKMSSGR